MLRARLEWHLLAVLHVSDSFQQDTVVRGESLVDYEAVLGFASDRDLALVGDVVFVDDVNVSLAENLERGAVCVVKRCVVLDCRNG